MKSSVYLDKRIYAMKLRNGLEYSIKHVKYPVNIRNFKPVCRIMANEIDYGTYDYPDTGTSTPCRIT